MRHKTPVPELVAFLKENYPDDVLMPVRVGTKHPMFVHKNGAWTWSHFDECNAEGTDYGIVLNQLCVVDVDDEKQAIELEAEFPVLTMAPMEKTARGRHYWFVRSAHADDRGHFDGANQRCKGVDFKSVCQTGTGGFIVIAPSSGKTWVRTLCNTRPFEIPDHLLEAVSVPRVQGVDAHLFFDDGGDLALTQCKWLRHFTYFEPFLVEEDWSLSNINVPCRKSTFEQVLYMLDHCELNMERPTRGEVRDMLDTADKLGLGLSFMNRLRYGIFQLDLHDTCPGWWATLRAEKVWRMAGASDDGLLVDVDSALTYAPILKNPNWLLPNIRACTMTTGDLVVHEQPEDRVRADLPDVVLQVPYGTAMPFLECFAFHTPLGLQWMIDGLACMIAGAR